MKKLNPAIARYFLYILIILCMAVASATSFAEQTPEAETPEAAIQQIEAGPEDQALTEQQTTIEDQGAATQTVLEKPDNSANAENPSNKKDKTIGIITNPSCVFCTFIFAVLCPPCKNFS